MDSEKKKYIGELLLEYSMIKEEDLDAGLRLQKDKGGRLGETLINLGKVTKDDIEWIISKQLDIPFFFIDEKSVDRELIDKFDREFLMSNKILPIYETDEEVAVVTDDPFNEGAMSYIKKLLGKKVKVSVGTASRIEKILGSFPAKAGASMGSIVRELSERFMGTSFYRLDFIQNMGGFKANVFGSGILKDAGVYDAELRREDVFAAFDSIKTPFLYEEFRQAGRLFISVYPLHAAEAPAIPRYPAVIGRFGLHRPEGMFFSDVPSHGCEGIFSLSGPVRGYPFFSIKERGHGRSIYTVDSMPASFEDFYVDIKVPSACPSCGGRGCEVCGGIGYTFRDVEGIFSSEELAGVLKG